MTNSQQKDSGQTTDSGQIRSVLTRGDARLRQVAQAISPQAISPQTVSPQAIAPLTISSQTNSLQGWIDDLIATAIATQGVGIAAPQIGLSERLFIVASRPNARYPSAPQMEPTAMINPQLIDCSDISELGWEGCLSVPDCRAQVARARDIRVEYLDRWGQLQRSQFSGFVARIFQHELDHLNGILFVDRVNPTDCITEAEYQAELEAQSEEN